MTKLPQNISDLMLSDAYKNSNHPDFESTHQIVGDYFKEKYPGSSKMDATGRHTSNRMGYIWHAEMDEKTCDDCASFNDVVYEDEKDIPKHPHHPNCRCWIEKVQMDDNGTILSDDSDNIILLDLLLENDPITQKELNAYNQKHPKFNFPENVKNLAKGQQVQIYKENHPKQVTIASYV